MFWFASQMGEASGIETRVLRKGLLELSNCALGVSEGRKLGISRSGFAANQQDANIRAHLGSPVYQLSNCT